MGYLISETTKKEREQIVAGSLGEHRSDMRWMYVGSG